MDILNSEWSKNSLKINSINKNSQVQCVISFCLKYPKKNSYLQFWRMAYQPNRGARHRISKPLDDGQNGGNSCQYDNGLLNMIQSSQKIQYWLIDRFKLFSHLPGSPRNPPKFQTFTILWISNISTLIWMALIVNWMYVKPNNVNKQNIKNEENETKFIGLTRYARNW